MSKICFVKQHSHSLWNHFRPRCEMSFSLPERCLGRDNVPVYEKNPMKRACTISKSVPLAWHNLTLKDLRLWLFNKGAALLRSPFDLCIYACLQRLREELLKLLVGWCLLPQTPCRDLVVQQQHLPLPMSLNRQSQYLVLHQIRQKNVVEASN